MSATRGRTMNGVDSAQALNAINSGPDTNGSVPVSERLALTVEEAGALLGISRDLAYDLVNTRQLPSVRLGRRIVVPRRALEQLLETAVLSDGGATTWTPPAAAPGPARR